MQHKGLLVEIVGLLKTVTRGILTIKINFDE